ncbi:hypothetical protein [Methylobacterium sp. D48H]
MATPEIRVRPVRRGDADLADARVPSATTISGIESTTRSAQQIRDHAKLAGSRHAGKAAIDLSQINDRPHGYRMLGP